MLDFDTFWNDAKVVEKVDVKSSLFNVNRNTFMKETKMVKLKRRKDKTSFLDTVVFGIVFRKPTT